MTNNHKTRIEDSIDWESIPLGKRPDAEDARILSERYGVEIKASTVASQRQSRKIKAFSDRFTNLRGERCGVARESQRSSRPGR